MAVSRLSLLLVTLVTLAHSLAHVDASQESTFSKVISAKAIITTYSDVTYTPPMFIFGQHNGSIVRCPHSTPTTCEEYHSADSAVNAVLVHGEFLFAALESGSMLRCSWERRYSCQEFHEAGSEVTGLAVAAGHIHAGLRNGTVLRCSMNMAHSCRSFAELERFITSLAASDDYIYVGSNIGHIDRCDIGGNNCSLFCHSGGTGVSGLGVVNDRVFGVRHTGFIQNGDGASDICESFELSGCGYAGMTAYNGKLYMAKKDQIRIHVPGDGGNTTLFASYQGIKSISFAYATYVIQDKYLNESENCFWKGVIRCPPTVFYYEVQHRLPLEVFVKNGRLHDSQGAVVDTSDADEAHGQKAAIFVMGPDGQILLSKVHSTGLLHTSSLLAGSLVSGAGLMQVEQGRIKKITACSSHYRPDEDLNEQVKMSLRAKGYKDPIDSQMCTYSDLTCGLTELNELGEVY